MPNHYFQAIMSTCPSNTKTTCCDCPSQAEIDAFMQKEDRMKFLRDILLPRARIAALCQLCVVEASAREYVRSIPIYHTANQQKVNTELWQQWNIADHERAMEGPYEFEKEIYSEGVERLRDPNVPPPLTLGYSICSRRWGQEQKHFLYARIGDIIILKSLAPSETVWVTYALRRIEGLFRWTKYIVYHSPQESCVEVMNSLMARYEPPELFYARLRAAGFPVPAALPAK